MAQRLSIQAEYPFPYQTTITYPVLNPKALGNVRTNEVGSAYRIPILLTVSAIASNVLTDVITPVVLPQGVYSIYSCIEVSSSVASAITGYSITTVNGAFFSDSELTKSTAFLSMCSNYISDGSTPLELQVYITLASGTWSINTTQGNHILQVVRIA